MAQAKTTKPKLVETLNRYARFMQASERVMRAHDGMWERATVNAEALAEGMETLTGYLASDGPETSVEDAPVN